MTDIVRLLSAVTANTTGAACDTGGLKNEAALEVFTTGAVSAFSVQLQGSLDGTNWVSLGSPVTTATTSVLTSTILARYFRAVLSGYSGTGSVTAVLAFAAGAGQGAGGSGASLPLTTLGDLLYEDATPAAARLAGNTAATKKFLTQTGNGTISAVPTWGTIAADDVPTLNQNTTGTAAGLSATLAIGSGGTGSTTRTWMGLLTRTAVKTGAYTAAAGDLVPCDTTSAAFTVTLPTAPADATVVGVKLVILGGTNAVTVAAGGSDVFNKASGSTTLTLSRAMQALYLEYQSSTAIWTVVADDAAYSTLDQLGAAAANVSMGSHKLTSLTAGTASTDAVNVSQVPGIGANTSAVAPVTIAAAAGETTIASFTFPAGQTAPQTWRILGYGTMSIGGTGGNVKGQVRVGGIGGSILCFDTTASFTASGTGAFRFDTEVSLQVAGASGTYAGCILNSANTTATTGGGTGCGTVTADSTATQSIVLTITFGSATTSGSCVGSTIWRVV